MPKRTQSPYRYVSDTGTNFILNLADDIGTEAALGFVAADGTELTPPMGFEPRRVLLSTPDGTRRASRPVGTLAATAWATPLAIAVPLDQWNDAADVSMVVTMKQGERLSYRRRPLPI